jgi:hypothetical protein
MLVRTTTAALMLALGALSGCGGDGDGDVQAFCSSFDELSREGADALTVEQGLDVVDELASTAPDGVRADAATAQEGLHTITEAVEDAGFTLDDIDDPSQLSEAEQARMQAATEDSGVDQGELAQAFADLETWSADNC